MSRSSEIREQPSDEADRAQLGLARQTGVAYANSVEYMASVVAHTGGLKRAGDMIVAFAQERAEGMYEFRNGSLEWVKPGEDENCHIEIAVMDAGDHRFIPELDVLVTVIDENGREIGSRKMPFLWHPGLYHYGGNWAVPGDGVYTFRIDIAAPTFPRHDKKNGRRYAKPVRAEFENVQVKTGRE